MANEVTWAMRFATLVAVWHILVSIYLVFFAERLTPFLWAAAIVKTALGVIIYLLVRRPVWAVRHQIYEMGVLVPIGVVLLLAVSVLMTALIWKAYELKAPTDRIREILTGEDEGINDTED